MMEYSSHLIEIKKFMDKYVVCDIEVQDVSLTASGLNVKTNKWLHLEDWLELDSTIDDLFQSFARSETLDDFEADVFYLGGAIRVDCRKIKMSQAHKKILGAEKSYLPLALNIRITKVNTSALVEQINRFEEKLFQLSENTNKSRVEEQNDLLHKENVREYDPTASDNGSKKVGNNYAPYTASVKSSNGSSAVDTSLSDNEPYSPKPVSLSDSSPDQILKSSAEIPTYRPARIPQTRQVSDGQQRSESVKLRSRQLPSTEASKLKCGLPPAEIAMVKRSPARGLKTTNAELFGSDDSEPDRFASPPALAKSPKRVATPLRTPDSNTLHPEIKRKRLKLRHKEPSNKTPIDSWLSKETIERMDKSNERPPKRTSRFPHSSSELRSRTPTEPTAERSKSQASVELRQIKEFSALRDTIKSKRKSPPPAMEIL